MPETFSPQHGLVALHMLEGDGQGYGEMQRRITIDMIASGTVRPAAPLEGGPRSLLPILREKILPATGHEATISDNESCFSFIRRMSSLISSLLPYFWNNFSASLHKPYAVMMSPRPSEIRAL